MLYGDEKNFTLDATCGAVGLVRTLVRERLVREAERLARAGRRAERFRDQRCVRVDERRSGEPERDQAAGEHYQHKYGADMNNDLLKSLGEVVFQDSEYPTYIVKIN